jgi:hypothetical protein
MSLARAFTTKRTKQPQISAPMPQRSMTTKRSFTSGTIRNKISAPVELLSTTNMLSYNAPDIYPISSSSSSSSVSGDESDTGSLPTNASSPPTSPNSSTMGDSPSPNHLSCYFNAPSAGRQSSSSADDTTPSIPQRAASHTKKTHEMMSRKRSVSHVSSKASITSLTRDSIHMFQATPELKESPHPFGKELAQVTELAEEYGAGQMGTMDPEEQDLMERGLLKFGAQDYMDEIQDLFMGAFHEETGMSAMWI